MESGLALKPERPGAKAPITRTLSGLSERSKELNIVVNYEVEFAAKAYGRRNNTCHRAALRLVGEMDGSNCAFKLPMT